MEGNQMRRLKAPNPIASPQPWQVPRKKLDDRTLVLTLLLRSLKGTLTGTPVLPFKILVQTR